MSASSRRLPPGAVDSKFFGKRPSFGDQDSAAGYNDTQAHLRDIAPKLAGENQNPLYRSPCSG